MKKKILCIVLAVCIIAGAIAFAVYNRYGNKFDYANKDMTKYVSGITDKEVIKGLYDGSVTLETATDTDAAYLIAALMEKLNAESNKATTGVMGLYDTVMINYYAMQGETLVSLGSKMMPSSLSPVQLGADADISRVLAELSGKNFDDASYSTFTTGDLMEGDILYFDYSVTKGTSVEKQGTYVKATDAAAMNALYENLGTKFFEKYSEAKIGTALSLTLAEATETTEAVTASVTVKFVARTIVNGGAVQEEDTLYFSYTEGTDTEATTYYATLGTGNAALDTAFGTGFASGLAGLTIGTKGTVQATKNGETDPTSYQVTVEYARRADLSTTDDANIKLAEKPIEIEYTYPEDSEAASEIDATLLLAGKTVKYYVFPAYFYDLTYDFTTIADLDGYEPDEETAIGKFLLANKTMVDAKEELDDIQAALDKAQTSLNDATTAENNAQAAYDEAAAKTGDDAASPEELNTLSEALNTAKAAKDTAQAAMDTAQATYDEKHPAAQTAYTNAQTAYDEAKTAYEAELNANLAEGEAEVTADPDTAAQTYYNDLKKEEVQLTKDNTYAYAVSKIIWNKLIETAKENIKYPSKAVRVAYNGLIDSFKTEYYENNDKYAEYGTFKKYLELNLYPDVNYKDAVKEEARQVVLEKIVLYRVLEVYNITELNDNDKMMYQLYAAYSSASYAEEYKEGKLFDTAMTQIIQEINEEVWN